MKEKRKFQALPKNYLTLTYGHGYDKNIIMQQQISKKAFYNLLNEGLFQKYCKDAGPVQEINITYKNKSDIQISRKRKVFDSIEIDLVGNFVEEKIINADLSNPIHMETRLNEIKGTLFIRDNMTEDLILEL